MRVLRAIFAFSLFLVAPVVFASHLGPIVLGVERTELVFFCLKDTNAEKIIALEKASVARNGTVADFLNAAHPLITADECTTQIIRYKPIAVMQEWVGRNSGPNGVRVVPVALVRAEVLGLEQSLTVYVYSTEPPKKTTI